MRKIGIKKTWGNIFLLLGIGFLIGIVFGLRQPLPAETAQNTPAVITDK